MSKYIRLLPVIGLLVIIASCGNLSKRQVDASQLGITDTTAQGKMTSIHFDTIDHDFGTIHEGENVVYSYKFTNTGKNDLIIREVMASCGCTVTDYPKIPIKPGQSNDISIRFNTAGKRGFQTKNVTVITNTQPVETQLRFRAKVLPADKQE